MGTALRVIKSRNVSGAFIHHLIDLFHRWIYGRGCPILKAAVHFDAKTFVDVRLQQQGSAACRESTVRAMSISKDGEVGVLKVASLFYLYYWILFWRATYDHQTYPSITNTSLYFKISMSSDSCENCLKGSPLEVARINTPRSPATVVDTMRYGHQTSKQGKSQQ